MRHIDRLTSLIAFATVFATTAACAQIYGMEKGADRTEQDHQDVETQPECFGPVDCPGEDSACEFRTCSESGECGVAFIPEDTPLFDQVDGDCSLLVCDGAGATKVVVDDGDLPLDADQCTDDVCTNGVKSNPFASSGTVCGNALQCDGAGFCVGCVDATDCGTDSFCQTFSCEAGGICEFVLMPAGTPLMEADQTDNDCKVLECNIDGQAQVASDSSDIPLDDGLECTAQACLNGNPDYPPLPSNTACSQGGEFCDGNGVCVECNLASQCPSAASCEQATCEGNVCSTEPVGNGTACSDGSYCNGTETCSDGVCTNSSGNPCSGADGDGDCSESCSEATDSCTANDPNGTPCDDGAFCTGSSQTCSSGVCSGGSGNPCPGGDNDADCSETCNESANNCTNNDPNGANCAACPGGQQACELGECTGGACSGTVCIPANEECP